MPVLLDVSESMSMKDQRKLPEEIVEAAAALSMAPLDEEINAVQAVMKLDAGQRQKITASSRLDLAKAVLVDSARPIFESLGENLDLSYHSFGQAPRLISDDTVVASESELVAAIDASRTGRSSWRYLLIAGFILLLLESLFAEFLRKRKRSRSKQADPIPDNLTGVQDA